MAEDATGGGRAAAAWATPALLAAILALGGLAAALVLGHARAVNGGDGFPLDDPWIHLQFARNLADWGAWSYFRDEQVTSGSTSPLYTALLAAGLAVTHAPYALSYALGVLSLLGAGLLAFLLVRRLPGTHPATALGLAALVVLEPRLQWIALSGMETPLFILLMLASHLAYAARRPLALGAALALLVWTRPEGLAFALCLAGAEVYDRAWVRPADRPPGPRGRPLWPALAVLALGLGAYAAFNLTLSGTVLPNTVAAKLKHYALSTGDYLPEVARYLGTGHMAVLAPLALVGAGRVVASALRRRPEPGLVAFLWVFGLIAAYWRYLPYLYNNGRYLMPVIPYLALLGLLGAETFASALARAAGAPDRAALARRALPSFLAAALAVSFAWGTWDMRELYARSCREIGQRQVLAARWIRDHLPEDAVIATHDVGALAFVSGRRVVDMVGLVSPEMIRAIGDERLIEQTLADERVTHVAALRAWFEVVNVEPIFTSNPAEPPVMEVFPFDRERLHIMDREAQALNLDALAALRDGRRDAALTLLMRSARVDPKASRTFFLLGQALGQAGRFPEAVEALRHALSLHPGYWEARRGLAAALVASGRPDDAVADLEAFAAAHPPDPRPWRVLAELHARVRHDDEAAARARARAEALAAPGSAPP